MATGSNYGTNLIKTPTRLDGTASLSDAVNKAKDYIGVDVFEVNHIYPKLFKQVSDDVYTYSGNLSIFDSLKSALEDSGCDLEIVNYDDDAGKFILKKGVKHV